VTNDRFFADVQVRCFGHSRVMTSTAGPTDLLKDLDDAAQVPALRSQRRVASGGEHRPWASRQLHRLNEVSASSGATAVAAAISVLFLGPPSRYKTDCSQGGPCRRCGVVDAVSDARQGDVGWGGVDADWADHADRHR